MAATNGQSTACVFGASGFIGKKAVEVLASSGFQVRAAVRQPKGPLPHELQATGVEVVQADVCDVTTLAGALEGCSIAINCAGIYRWWLPDSSEYQAVNIDGAANVAQACLNSKSVHRLVHVSTAMAYGYPADRPFREDSKAGPHASEYARTKHLGDEKVASICHGSSNLSVVTLFLACVTGRGDTASVGRPAAVYRDFMLGKIPMLVAPDTNYIYVHIRDVQQAIRSVCTVPKGQLASNKYLIGNSAGMITTKQYFEIMGRLVGRPCPSMTMNLTLGYWLAWLLTWISTWVTKTEPILPLDIMRTARWGSIEYDCSKSVAELGISYTPIEEAVAEAVEDVRAQMKGRSVQIGTAEGDSKMD
eukprot:TRINITY_DN17439_c0_g1_i1.p1 TRINITY_DN17439_c0_g1~~TRINITY_DN17439_c0_g1_i1.p1  ORF type:complete len:362 (+),score=45.82 TRINITY_DN17439_c0_g1_i1:111-1196(+)